VIPAAPHGDKSNPNVALFPGFSPSGIARSSIAATSRHLRSIRHVGTIR
jgi:hypothetical protein